MKFHLRIFITILLIFLTLKAKAQWTKQDSINLQQLLQRDEEIHVNTDALLHINLNQFSNYSNKSFKPIIAEEKPWLNIIETIPQSFTDTTTQRKPKYIRLLPYTIWTRWDEDPFATNVNQTNKELKMSMRFDFESKSAVGSGLLTITFDADKLLFENLTKRGRTLKHNRKHANAWKNYQNLIPNKKDTTQKDSAVMKMLLQQIANELYPFPKDSILTDSLLFKHKINRQNQANESN